jgi:hypothetical protein
MPNFHLNKYQNYTLAQLKENAQEAVSEIHPNKVLRLAKTWEQLTSY